MIDICKLSKKNNICNFIFKNLLGIKIEEIYKEIYHLGSIDLEIENFFFLRL